MPTGAYPTIAETDPYYIDVNLATPAEQFDTLVQLIESADAKAPAPYTATPPWGEPVPQDEYVPDAVLESNFEPAPDIQADDQEALPQIISDAPGQIIPAPEWENDPQYYGLGVPPGVPNWGQPIETGHTQITLPNPGSEMGAFAWSGAISLARVARHENSFSGYSADTNRGHEIPAEKWGPAYNQARLAQTRNLMLAEINARGVHNLVMADVPAQTYNEQVIVIDPAGVTTVQSPPIGEEGVLP